MNLAVAGHAREDAPLRILRAGTALTAVYAVCLALVSATLSAAALTDRPIAYYTHDPLQAMQVVGLCDSAECSLAGMLSNATVIAWLTAAAVSLFAAAVLSATAKTPLLRSPLFWLGAYSLLLAIDDLFVVHEYSKYWNVGLGERRQLALYALAAVVLVVAFRAFLARTSVWLLGVAGGFLVVSVFFDLVVRNRDLVEDGAKLFGAATWALFLVGTSFQAVRRAVEREARPPR